MRSRTRGSRLWAAWRCSGAGCGGGSAVQAGAPEARIPAGPKVLQGCTICVSCRLACWTVLDRAAKAGKSGVNGGTNLVPAPAVPPSPRVREASSRASREAMSSRQRCAARSSAAPGYESCPGARRHRANLVTPGQSPVLRPRSRPFDMAATVLTKVQGRMRPSGQRAPSPSPCVRRADSRPGSLSSPWPEARSRPPEREWSRPDPLDRAGGWLLTVGGPEPAHATFNVGGWRGGAAPPFDPSFPRRYRSIGQGAAWSRPPGPP